MPANRRNDPYAGVIPALAVGLIVLAALSIRLGAVTVSFSDMLSALSKLRSA